MRFFKEFTTTGKLNELNNREDELFKAIIELYKTDKSKSSIGLTQNGIFEEYSKVHFKYTKLTSKSIEALKRALFIQWYCYTEPQYLTGIGNLKRENENETLLNLKKVLDTNKADKELLWMLNYYLTLDENLFDIYVDVFDYKLYLNEDENLPLKFESKNRGQMGEYWNSVINR